MKNLLLSSLLLVLTCALFGAETEVAETEEAAIEGVLIQRPDGSFMEFVLVENKINCRFYNADKQPIDPDVDRVAARIQRTQPRVRKVFTVAIPNQGVEGFRAPVFIQPPHIFRAYLSLMREGIDDPVEFYFVQYPQDLTATEPITIYESEETGEPNR
jgi:hypothetical protein